MAKYLFIYRGGNAAEEEFTPEEMQNHMQAWMDWIGEGMKSGWMLNPGDALLPESCTVDADGNVTDGPFVESKEIVGGYSVVEAASMAAAADLAKGCPIKLTKGLVEIRPLAEIAPPEGQSA